MNPGAPGVNVTAPPPVDRRTRSEGSERVLWILLSH